ncbi:MAG: hypothetical protein A2600_04980 [Candidatus Lambdaproteobacteria bacterium RIFOXYD1_FULL_56_27]|uniref:Amphi-Trp domain-containing protein n=1 Tax=Candidatus Lambdaproteobacteria bacterium RIFOXYD2_FULL_56_26 TaxID=1817773 RepID=A0A1F6GRZ4_9PROT|nr:MAG: hypothetical protein A2426_07835 [Candidatus Lambdaproteobacteria bacterium RIFOXYC1_FULL_56_13]OGH00828.1 MAG: hypothetical protein A2557_03905 [Candidatus Lambdaproteobacteria bacterium RIFOXYD2_FULL_56_26]OGH09907.1 MAG: hypothetical protein A2600_04980 [Candidatus Lambdaproteobacteria bacterium RIFOXYD1_FULL_56_27]
MQKKSFETKTRLKKEAAVLYLEELIKSLKAGKLVVQEGEEFVSLTPAQDLELELEASAGKSKERIFVSLHWSTEPALVEAPWTIGTKEPQSSAAAKPAQA